MESVSTSFESPELSSFPRRMWLIWGAMFTSPWFLLAVAAAIGQQADSELRESIPATPHILGGASLFILGFAFLVPSLFRGRIPTVPQGDDSETRAHQVMGMALMRFQRASILGWAMAEGGALLASVAVFIHGMLPLLLVSFPVFAVNMIVMAPTSTRIWRELKDALQDQGVAIQDAERLLPRS